MLELITYPGLFGEPSDSPFCLKAIYLLNLSGVNWQPTFTGDPRKAPKGKLPVLNNGTEVIADSEDIRAFLEKKTGLDFDEGLDQRERAISRALIRLADENLCFHLTCDRWMNDANWEHVKAGYFADIPALMRGFIANKVRKQVIGQAEGQGMGRHTVQERFERATKDINAIVTLLGEQDFLFGHKVTAADASVVAVLRQIAAAPVPTPTSRFVRENKTLMAYLDRGAAAMSGKTEGNVSQIRAA